MGGKEKRQVVVLGLEQEIYDLQVARGRGGEEGLGGEGDGMCLFIFYNFVRCDVAEICHKCPTNCPLRKGNTRGKCIFQSYFILLFLRGDLSGGEEGEDMRARVTTISPHFQILPLRNGPRVTHGKIGQILARTKFARNSRECENKTKLGLLSPRSVRLVSSVSCCLSLLLSSLIHQHA